MIFIEIDQKLKVNMDSVILEKACQVTLKEGLSLGDSDLTIVVTDDSRMTGLNLQFRKINKTTDVLSFPSDEIDPDTGKSYLGDVIISYPQACLQALQAGHPVESELQLLTVHGVLHLIGFDHAEKRTKIRMWKIQDIIMAKLGLPSIKIVENLDRSYFA